MQAEILAANPDSKIRILGINQTGQEASNALAVDGKSLPWLQDVLDEAWTAWLTTHRDVVILDREGRKYDVINLTERDLNVPEEYAVLKSMLLRAAGE